jgi:hypothetical protein
MEVCSRSGHFLVTVYFSYDSKLEVALIFSIISDGEAQRVLAGKC